MQYVSRHGRWSGEPAESTCTYRVICVRMGMVDISNTSFSNSLNFLNLPPQPQFTILTSTCIFHKSHSLLHRQLSSKTNSRVRFADSINSQTHSYHHCNSASIFTAELQAIFNCLETIISLPAWTSLRPYLIISDSQLWSSFQTCHQITLLSHAFSHY